MKGKYSLIILMILSLLSCDRDKREDEDILRIGFSAAPEIFLQERWDRDIKIFTSTAGDLDAEVIFAKSLANSQDQNAQIQYLLQQNIDVLVVIPQDMELIGGIIKRVMDRGIPVLSYDRPVMGVPISGYISFDNREVGRLMGKALINHVPRGNYLIVNGSVLDNNSYEVNAGVHEKIDPLALRGEINIVQEIWLDEWSYDEALEKMDAVLEGDVPIHAISAPNDNMAQAAIRLLAEKRLAGTVAVVGQDADLVACQSIVEGTQLMTVYKPIQNLAVRAAEIAVKLAQGHDPAPNRYLDNGSGLDIPFHVETPIPVYLEDMESVIINEGFHSREDIYRSGIAQN